MPTSCLSSISIRPAPPSPSRASAAASKAIGLRPTRPLANRPVGSLMIGVVPFVVRNRGYRWGQT